MSIIAWVTAAFGALVIGVAASSVMDELLYQAAQLRPNRLSKTGIARAVITVIVSLAAMAAWVWFWMEYVVAG